MYPIKSVKVDDGGASLIKFCRENNISILFSNIDDTGEEQFVPLPSDQYFFFPPHSLDAPPIPKSELTSHKFQLVWNDTVRQYKGKDNVHVGG